MKVLLAPCPRCNVDQEARVRSTCDQCDPPHADAECEFCGLRWCEVNPETYEKLPSVETR